MQSILAQEGLLISFKLHTIFLQIFNLIFFFLIVIIFQIRLYFLIQFYVKKDTDTREHSD